MDDSGHGELLREVMFGFFADGGVTVSHDDITLDEFRRLHGALFLILLGNVHRQFGRAGVVEEIAVILEASGAFIADMERGDLHGAVIDHLGEEEP